MRWFLMTVSYIVIFGAFAEPAYSDQRYWELICEEDFGNADLACGVRKDAIMIYRDSNGRRDLTLGFEHHSQRTTGELEHLQDFRFRIDDSAWFSWRLGYESASTFNQFVDQMKTAERISTGHRHFTSHVEFIETATVDQGFRDAMTEMDRLIEESSGE